MKIQSHNAHLFINHCNALGIGWSDFNRLSRIENYCHRIALNLANDGHFEIPDDWSDKQIKKVIAICPKLGGQNLFINLDPRGYAMKVIDPPLAMHRDFGGYGIVAPEF